MKPATLQNYVTQNKIQAGKNKPSVTHRTSSGLLRTVTSVLITAARAWSTTTCNVPARSSWRRSCWCLLWLCALLHVNTCYQMTLFETHATSSVESSLESNFIWEKCSSCHIYSFISLFFGPSVRGYLGLNKASELVSLFTVQVPFCPQRNPVNHCFMGEIAALIGPESLS